MNASFMLEMLVIPFSDLTKAFGQEGGLDTVSLGDALFEVPSKAGNGISVFGYLFHKICYN